MIQYLDKLGVKFEKDGAGEYNMRKGPSPRDLCVCRARGAQRQEGALPTAPPPAVAVTNRYMATRLLKSRDARSPARRVSTREPRVSGGARQSVILACGPQAGSAFRVGLHVRNV